MGPYDIYRNDVLQCSQWLSEHGYFGTIRGTGGNVSIRVPGENTMVITPTGRRYDQMQLTDICVLDFDLKSRSCDLAPSVESALHLAVYKARPDTNAVVHTHQPYASILAVINTPLPALFDEVMFSLGERVEIIPYALSGSPDLVANVESKLGNFCHCYIMQNHGILCLGETLDKAWLNAELLEKTAKIYCYALATGKEITTLPEHIVSVLTSIRKEMIQKVSANS